MKRLKVFVSCYACSPRQGSEPGMGWEFVKAISKDHELWVVSEQEKWESEIEAELAAHPELQEQIRFFFIPKQRRRTLRKVWPPSYYWYYKKWQKETYQLACKLHKQVRFDLVHQLNMVGFREPGYLWNLPVPFVWGPVGGMVQLPWRFLRSLGPSGAIYHAGRNVFNALQTKYLLRPRKAARRAGKGLIAATPEMRVRMQKLWGVDSCVLCEFGQTKVASPTVTSRENGEPMRLVWSGSHISQKGLPLLLKGLGELKGNVNWKLDILGEGVKSRTWRRLARNLHMQDRCSWHGWLPRDKAFSIIRGAHVFVITSLMDLTSSVTFEALSHGLPVMCLDHCGFADVVNEDCGIKIPVTTPRQVSLSIARAIEALDADEAYRRRLAAGALRRAEDFSWEKKMETLNRIYSEVVG